MVAGQAAADWKEGLERADEAIDSGLTAEAAIERVQQHTRMRMRQIDDPLLADLIAAAQAASPDLAQARSRLAQARAAQVSAGAALLPSRLLRAVVPGSPCPRGTHSR